jgi:hypothetical protein
VDVPPIGIVSEALEECGFRRGVPLGHPERHAVSKQELRIGRKRTGAATLQIR